MPTVYGTLNWYDNGKLNLLKSVNLASDTLKVFLTTSSYAPNAETHATISDITNEVTGSGYARQTLTGVSLTVSAGLVTLDFTNPVFTASGGSIVARYWGLFDDTVTSPADPLLCYGLLDASNLDVTIASGESFTLAVNPLGLFNLY